jgi:hypothetical protein
MLARLALLLVALPAVALAQTASAPSSTPAAPPHPAATPAPAPVQPQLASIAPAPPADPAQCRIACAQTNYFCRAGAQPDDCGGAWSQCVSTCDLPDMAPDTSTAP